MFSRRQWIASTTGAALASTVQAQASKRPNVVLIMTDDQGYGDLSCHGNPHFKTPNIDRLASQSTEFTRFYVSPVCAPTRASLMTGRYNLRCGVFGVTRGYETMRSNETTIAEALKGGGYNTALIGKWHLGEHYPYVPHAQGFDRFVGFRTGHWNIYNDPPLERNGDAIRGKGYITDFITDEAIDFIGRGQQQPFFLYVAYNAPHSPFIVPEKFMQELEAAGLDKTTQAVYAMVHSIDENIARLMKKLDELKLSDNTIVIFLTDNGPNGDRYNAGLRGRKGSVYEGGVRAPFFIRWPGKFTAGKKIETIAAHIDVYPTLLDLCGVERPKGLPIDGLSLRPLLEAKSTPSSWPDRMLFTHRETERDPSTTYPGTVRTQRFNLVNGKELYEIPNDPGEQKDVSAKYPEKTAELRAAYETWYAEASKQCGFQRTPIPVGYKEEDPVSLAAPQSYFNGELKYHNDSGFAHDWITGWTREGDEVWWEIDVVRAGAFEVSLRYLCPASDVGAEIACGVDGSMTSAKVQKSTSMEMLPNQNVVPGMHYHLMQWETLKAGTVKLPKGRTRFVVKAKSKPGKSVMDLQSVWLRRV